MEAFKVFIPEELRSEPVKFDDSLAPIVERIGAYLTSEEIWKYFSSSPSETGGIRKFPYCRVDSCLIVCRDLLHLARLRETETDDYLSDYDKASKQAMRLGLWVEIGFEGLKHLAVHPASRNWTSAVGHLVSDEERAQGIMTRGKNFYEEVLKEFVKFRDDQQITDDCFTQYGLGHLLDKWRDIP